MKSSRPTGIHHSPPLDFGGLATHANVSRSQSDVVHLKGEDIDWESRVVSFFRSKTGTAQIIHFGGGLAEVLRGLAPSGPLFPRLPEAMWLWTEALRLRRVNS